MKVLLVADIVGGVRTFTRELVMELTERDVEVHLALLGAPPAGGEGLDASSCEIRDLRLEWMTDPWRDVSTTADWIEELRARHRPDVIHMNTFTPVLDDRVPVLLTAHSCVLTWWRAVHGTDAPPTWRRYRDLVTRALARADHLAVPTRALLNVLKQVYPTLPPSSVIPNGRRVSAAVPPASSREQLVLAVGRVWDVAKNIALLAAAAPAIDARVVAIGAGEAGGAIEHVGPLSESEVISWLLRASVFAEPARYEPFGLAALEAALCGCALVLGDIPALREVWGDAAVFVPTDDPEVLAWTVNALLADPERRVAAAERARSRAARYSPSVTADRYLALYQQLAPVAVAA